MAKTHLYLKRLALYGLTPCALACSSQADNSVIRAIPGTEQVAIYDFCISVSPDEKWLAFSEWTLPKDRVFEDLPTGQYYSRVATLDMTTGEVVRHTVESIPAKAFGFSDKDMSWVRLAGLEIIEDRFRPAGWQNGRFYFQPYYHDIYFALDPRAPGIQVTTDPGAGGECSDCPLVSTVQFAGRAWDLGLDEVSGVFRNGIVRTVYYRGEDPQRSSSIFRIREDGSEEVVVEKQRKERTFTIIMSVRVSRDERYLAYVLHSKKDALMAGPREEIFIRELETGREKRIAAYAYTGNLIWSPSGDRLYFAGGAYDSDSAVRVVDVKAALPQSESIGP